MFRPVALAAVFLVPLLAGCTIVQEPEAREIAGPTDGYTPTAAFLKVHVRRDDGSVALLDFDRRDWYTAKIAEMLDLKQARYVSSQAMPRGIIGEYLAISVADPGEIAKLRYDDMGATPQQRARMDTEYEALLARVLGPPPEGAAPKDVALPAAPV